MVFPSAYLSGAILFYVVVDYWFYVRGVLSGKLWKGAGKAMHQKNQLECKVEKLEF